MLFLLLLQLINYMNDKFQKYKDVLAPPQDKIRLKRKVNETSEHLSRHSLSSKLSANSQNKTLTRDINQDPPKEESLPKKNMSGIKINGGHLSLSMMCVCL